MDEVIEAQRQLAASKQHLQDTVTTARDQGHTWQEIGDALDMTRQAAFKRFGKPTRPGEGEPLTPVPIGPLLDTAERAFGLVATAGYDGLHQMMTPATAEALTADLIAETWSKVLSEVGELEACDDTRAELPDGSPLDPEESVLGAVVVATTLRCEAGEVLGRIAFDDNREIIGMLIVPHDHGDLPF